MPKRKSQRLKNYDYTQKGMYFVTICIKSREDLFGKIVNDQIQLSAQGEIVRKIWEDLSFRFDKVKIDDYVIMPDHFHGIIKIDQNSVGAIHESPFDVQLKTSRRHMTLPMVIGYFKMNTAKQINQTLGVSKVSLWQRGYHDRIIRDDNELQIIRAYIRNNPINGKRAIRESPLRS